MTDESSPHSHLDNSPRPTAIVHEGFFVYANRAFLDRLGYLHHWRPPASGYYESTCLLCPTPRHTAAVLVLADRPAVRFVVDTWLRDNGSLPLVAPEGPWRRLFIYRDNDRLNPWFGLEELQVYCDSGFFGPEKLAAAERAVAEAAAER